MAGEGGATLSFVDLPEDIHFAIAKIIDPRLCSSPSSQHASDPDFTSEVYSHCQPDLALARLTLVCKRLQRIYAPFSTRRSLYIEVKTLRSAQRLGRKYVPSPSLTRVLKYPETGIYARELLIRCVTLKKGSRCHDDNGFGDELTYGNLVGFDQFLANTPQLDTVRCIDTRHDGYCVRLPYQFFASLSSLASLRYLYLGGQFCYFESLKVPPLHQVRILRYYPGPYCAAFFKDILRFSMPNIHTLYVNPFRDDPPYSWNSCTSTRATCHILVAIEVRCHVPHLSSAKSALSYVNPFFLLRGTHSVKHHHIEAEPSSVEYSVKIGLSVSKKDLRLPARRKPPQSHVEVSRP
jgi:hypothetical protein